MRAYTSLILPDLKEALEGGDEKLVLAAVEDLLAPDLADICANLDSKVAARLLTLLPLDHATEVLEQLEAETQREMLAALGRPRLVRMLDAMRPDDRADLMKRLPEATVELLMPLLAQAERNDVKRLVSYPEETAGALMTTEYVWLRAELTADEALKKLRQVAPDSETIYYLYVVDGERRLQGAVSLRDLICAPPGARLGEVMTQHPVTVRTDQDQEEIARLFEKYDLGVIPVVDPETERLVGIITVDDVIDVIEDEATEDVQMLGAVAPLERGYMETSVPLLVRKRVVWLAVLLIAQNATAFAIGHFQLVVKDVVVLLLIPFIPLVNSSGGNAGSQSATLITRALATGDLELKDALRAVLREAASGLLLGALLAVIGVVSVLLAGAGAKVLLVVACAISVVVTVGAILGTVIPLGFHRIGIDPAVASAPLIASVSDVIGITTYFGLAYLWLQ